MTFSTFLRPAAIIAAALSLAACGGKASFPINGTASGVVYPGLVITTNGMDLPIQPGTTTFSFPNSLSYGEVYAVTVKTPPAHQFCNTVDPLTGRETSTDTAGRLAAINISVACYVSTHAIGGTVSGLTGDSKVVLTNGSAGSVSVAAAVPATTTPIAYTFSGAVAYNVSYGVTVLTQPAGFTCNVANGTGVMGDADVTNINVTCAPNGT